MTEAISGIAPAIQEDILPQQILPHSHANTNAAPFAYDPEVARLEARKALRDSKNKSLGCWMGGVVLAAALVVGSCAEISSFIGSIGPKGNILSISKVDTELDGVSFANDDIVENGEAKSTDTVTTTFDLTFPFGIHFRPPASNMSESAYVDADVSAEVAGQGIEIKAMRDPDPNSKGQIETVVEVDTDDVSIQLLNETHQQASNDQELIKLINAFGIDTGDTQLANDVLGMDEDNMKLTCGETMANPDDLGSSIANNVRYQISSVADGLKSVEPAVSKDLKEVAGDPILIEYYTPGQIVGKRIFVSPSEFTLNLPKAIPKDLSINYGVGTITFESNVNVCKPTKAAEQELAKIKATKGYSVAIEPIELNG